MFRGQCAFVYWQESRFLGILKVVQHDGDESRGRLLQCICSFVHWFSEYLLRISKGQYLLSIGDIAANKIGQVPTLTGAYVVL